MKRHFCILAAALTLGCASADFQTYTPVEAETKFSGEELYTAAVRSLVRQGYGFAQRDPLALAIETDYVERPYADGKAYGYSWRIITSGGNLTIFASCWHLDAWKSFVPRKEPCGNARPSDVIAEQRSLYEMILADAARTRG